LAADEHSLIPVICGPTAAGKSDIALRLARRLPTTIIVADSRQIYRGFDIGTAKPTAAEQSLVPHRGIDVAAPTERYSAALWAAHANRWIDRAIAEDRIPVVVGGTGFYLRALFDPLFEEPVLDQSQRLQLEELLDGMSLADLRRWTNVLDPDRAHLGRTQLLRSIEVGLLTGRRLSTLHRERARPAEHSARYLVVDPGPLLAPRITARLNEMLSRGWVEEVEKLMDEVPEDAPAWKSSGYRVMRSYAAGEIDATAAREAVLIETRQYAKRQRTWLRHQLDDRLVTRVDPTDSSCIEAVDRWWDEVAEGRA
jgi:tRNA dimethylallyltransferase